MLAQQALALLPVLEAQPLNMHLSRMAVLTQAALVEPPVLTSVMAFRLGVVHADLRWVMGMLEEGLAAITTATAAVLELAVPEV